MPAGAKINNTLNGGYHVADDFDPEKLRRIARIRQREEAQRLKEKGLDENSIRVTFMTPFTIVCSSCNRHIAARTKVYVNVSRAPEKYLGKITVHQQKMRCPMPGCNNQITMIVNPKTRMYEVKSGGQALGVATEAEILEKMKQEESMKEKHRTVGGGGVMNEGKSAEELASFEEIQQMILEESAKLDALGDNYTDEKSQVAKIRAAREKQSNKDSAAENDEKELERRELQEKFQEARRQMRSMLKKDKNISTFGDDDNNDGQENNNNEDSSKQPNMTATQIEFARKAKVIENKLSTAIVDALALFESFEANDQNNSNNNDTNNKNQPAVPTNSAAATNKKKGSLLQSMFSSDDDQ